LVKNVLAREFEQTLTIDLEARRDLHTHFDRNLEPQSILKGLEFAVGRIIPGKTLLFIDEIQACPRAIMALRYFYEMMPSLHVVAAGSLLEFAFGDISIPVGRIQYLNLYPMTFYEYLLATDKQAMAQQVLSYQDDLENSLQQAILEELKTYFFVGGMPEAVRTYRDTGSLLETFSVQSDIIDSYRDVFQNIRHEWM